MRKILRAAGRLTAITASCAIGGATAAAQTVGIPYGGSYYINDTVSHGLSLPPVSLPNGSDEVRAADGTTCRTSMSGNGAYMDVGAISNGGADGYQASASVYGRMIFPLGAQPSRIDCSALYRLEIDRLKTELEFARMGAGAAAPHAGGPLAESRSPPWLAEGWSRDGWQSRTTVAKE
ncbi:MAG: hypothetical protein ACT4OU_06610 [Hyphomicrobium sp.]